VDCAECYDGGAWCCGLECCTRVGGGILGAVGLVKGAGKEEGEGCEEGDECKINGAGDGGQEETGADVKEQREEERE
jgi:hypothetical protein